MQVRTTHTGSLHRPPELVPLLVAHEAGEEVPGLEEAVREAVRGAVAHQLDIGIDIVNDGEQGRRAYATYVLDRLEGFEPAVTPPRRHVYLEEFPDFAEVLAHLHPSLQSQPKLPACTGPISVRDSGAVNRDIAMLAAAATELGLAPEQVFMTAVSPGTAAVFLENLYYPTKEEYLGALSDAMRGEYRAIVEAGFMLQIDCPDFTMRMDPKVREMAIEEIRSDISLSIAAVNAAVADLPGERMRLHLCWGNNEVPHTHDIALREIIDLVVTARPAGISVEAANPRHGHEWEVFEEFRLPEDKYLLPGVIDSTTNFVEHPELVAQRLRNYTRTLGNERVIASTDCGFGTHAGSNRIAPSVAWAKLASMVEGAELASR